MEPMRWEVFVRFRISPHLCEYLFTRVEEMPSLFSLSVGALEVDFGGILFLARGLGDTRRK